MTPRPPPPPHATLGVVSPSVAKARAALASIGASAALAVAKLAAGLLSGSLALVSDAGHAGLDTLAAALTYFAVRAADRPADENHHYGHAKIEAVAALVETGVLFALALAVASGAVARLLSAAPPQVAAGPVAYGVLIVSIVVDFVRWKGLASVARATGSHALAADALHFSSDLIASALVLAGLAAQRLGYQDGDAVAALGVAAFIAFAGLRLGKRTFDALTDAAPRGVSEQVRDVARSVPGVIAVDALRLRPSGAGVLGELEVAVPRTLPIEAVDVVRADVMRALSRAVPEANLVVSASARALDSETMREKILLIAARRGVAVHHVTIQDIDSRKAVSLDVELDARMTLGAAHEIASRLEAAIKAEIGEVEVETHIEPLEADERPGAEADPSLREAIAAALARAAAEGGLVAHVHGVRARVTTHGYTVNYHCHAPAALSVEATHEAVDRLDRAVRRDFPEVTRIVGHAEPLP